MRAPYFLVAAFAPAMAAQGAGSIINVSSMAGRIGLAAAAAYGATKTALESMTRSWAAEFSPHGVRVNAIAPGPVYTDGAAPERTTALGATTLFDAQPFLTGFQNSSARNGCCRLGHCAQAIRRFAEYAIWLRCGNGRMTHLVCNYQIWLYW